MKPKAERLPMSPRGSCLLRDATGRKLCVTCREWLDVAEFSTHPATRDRLQSRCRRCFTLSKYRMTKDDFTELLLAQGDRCAICHAPYSTGKGWHVDHDHGCCPGPRSCGDCVRGILCHRCNTGIGSLLESSTILARALAYLERRELST